MLLTESEQQALRREIQEAAEAMSAMFKHRLAERQAIRTDEYRSDMPAGRNRRRLAVRHP